MQCEKKILKNKIKNKEMLTNVVFRCAIFITSESSDTPLQPQWDVGKTLFSVQAIGNPVA